MIDVHVFVVCSELFDKLTLSNVPEFDGSILVSIQMRERDVTYYMYLNMVLVYNTLWKVADCSLVDNLIAKKLILPMFRPDAPVLLSKFLCYQVVYKRTVSNFPWPQEQLRIHLVQYTMIILTQ